MSEEQYANQKYAPQVTNKMLKIEWPTQNT